MLCLHCSAQTGRRKKNSNKPKKQKSIFLVIHKGSTCGHQQQETLLEKNEKEEQYLQAGSALPVGPLCGSVQSRLGRLESSSWGRASRGRRGVRGGRKRGEQSLHRPLLGSFVCHALEKGGSECKGKSNSLKYLLVDSFF